jgi:hypothetical protein
MPHHNHHGHRQFLLDEDEMLSFGLSLVGFDQTTTGQNICKDLHI